MILQIFADADELVHDRDTEVGEQRRRADARKLQQLRSLYRSGAEQHLAPSRHTRVAGGSTIDDADGAATVEDDPGDAGSGGDPQIAPVTRGSEIRNRGAAAPAVLGAEMVIADTFLNGAVEVVVARNVELIARGDDGFDQLVFSADGRMPHRTVEAVVSGVAVDRMLEPLEVRQDIGIAPTVIARSRPMVVILALAADRDQPVDRARTAERLSARPVDPAAVHSGVGLGVEAPVHASVEHGLGVTDGNVNPRIGVARPCLEQQHRMAAVGGEPIGEDAARRTRADDDVISRERGHRWRGGKKRFRSPGKYAKRRDFGEFAADTLRRRRFSRRGLTWRYGNCYTVRFRRRGSRAVKGSRL